MSQIFRLPVPGRLGGGGKHADSTMKYEDSSTQSAVRYGSLLQSLRGSEVGVHPLKLISNLSR